MEHGEDLTMHRETLTIEGGRKLYNYTFLEADSAAQDAHEAAVKEEGDGSSQPPAVPATEDGGREPQK